MVLDLSASPAFDLCRRDMQQIIFGFLRARRVAMVCLAPPCSSWSSARRGPADYSGPPPPLRSKAAILGLPGLRTADEHRVKTGNATMRFCARVLSLCAEQGVPALMENPQNSLIWHAAPMQRVSRLRKASLAVCHQCQYGARWRKATSLLMVNVPTALQDRLRLRCQGRAVCDRSGKPHITLSGVDPVSKKFWAALAQGYSLEFARFIANVLSQSFEQRSMVRYREISGR